MVYLDDSIMKKGNPATAGSRILENFVAPFDATVVTRLTGNIESVRLGEFGLEAPGELHGSLMLCNDVFGHVRSKAAEQGLCYIRPTYGTVSRYGLIPTACSMDQIGVVCKDPSEGFGLLSKIAGHDENDGAMFPEKSYSYQAEKKEIRWGVCYGPEDDVIPIDSFMSKTGVTEYAKIAEDCFDVSREVLNILAYAEISNNLSRYDGIKFGYRASNYNGLNGLYTKSRTEAFGLEAKLAAIMGCMVLSQGYYEKYYEKAMKIRRLIKESLRFDQYDVLVLPAKSPLAVLAGLPSLTFGDVELAANVKNENFLMTAWEALQ